MNEASKAIRSSFEEVKSSLFSSLHVALSQRCRCWFGTDLVADNNNSFNSNNFNDNNNCTNVSHSAVYLITIGITLRRCRAAAN